MLYFNAHTHHPAAAGQTALCCTSPQAFARRVADPPGALTRYAVGIHPWQADEADEAVWAALAQAVRHPDVVAVGEAGLDRLQGPAPAVQQAAFRRQALLSEEVGKPLVLHCVRAVDEVLALRREVHARRPWIWHAFRGGAPQLRQLAAHGFSFSFGPRFREEALVACPPEHLLLETDDLPFSLLPPLYARVAALRGLTPEALARLQRTNFERLFSNK